MVGAFWKMVRAEVRKGGEWLSYQMPISTLNGQRWATGIGQAKMPAHAG